MINQEEIEKYARDRYFEGYRQAKEEEKIKAEQKKLMATIHGVRDYGEEQFFSELGHFFFNYYNNYYSIKNNYMFRFLYLCTYMNYEGVLSWGGHGCELIKESELPDILKLGKAEFHNTKTYLIEEDFIHINKDKTISVNKKYCKKGSVSGQDKQDKIRMFNDGIRELYEESKSKDHSKIGILMKLIGSVNYKWNVVCANPNESDTNKIYPLTMKEICMLVDYAPNHSTRLKTQLLGLRVKGERVFMGLLTDEGLYFVINPRVFYKGSNDDYAHVKYLIGLFEITDSESKVRKLFN